MNSRLEKLRKPYLIPDYGTVLINYDRSKRIRRPSVQESTSGVLIHKSEMCNDKSYGGFEPQATSSKKNGS